jgi:hypothetical protein
VDSNDDNDRISSNHVHINYDLIEKLIQDFDDHFIERLQLDEDQVSFVKDVVGKIKKNELTPALKISQVN